MFKDRAALRVLAHISTSITTTVVVSLIDKQSTQEGHLLEHVPFLIEYVVTVLLILEIPTVFVQHAGRDISNFPKGRGGAPDFASPLCEQVERSSQVVHGEIVDVDMICKSLIFLFW